MRRFNLTLIALFAYTCSALSWGAKGHDIIAEVAQRHLTPAAQAEVERLLEGRTMVYYSTWMDDIRYIDGYRHTAPWHYVNVEKGSYADSPKNPDGDVYTAVVKMSDAVKSGQLDDDQKAYFLKALVHFVGDLHCPMHAGKKSDLGGNRFDLEWFGRSTNLHKIWDSSLLESTRSWSYSEWADNLDTPYYRTRLGHVASDPMELWVEQSIEAAAQIYSEVKEGRDYSWDYIREHKTLLEEKLLTAGYRLAALLNTLFDPTYSSEQG